ncbi:MULTISPECIES: hypothetical protein [unclassified Mesorhizobium]|uniref:hypothetical protein n=1 Tax=unclassified Mesorhizobium TaxID=325217 RepID=UPI001125E6D1|nr:MULTISPECIES: hypothetical protein [unclassified Mesorhizobium]TPJ30519.1 hypothetical protein FJ418_23460 [Mesorhizobium sp. B2-8-3]UCI24098.1 hypothetical protein FJ430_21135 [Mesorhizobium sp. B2-8-5]
MAASLGYILLFLAIISFAVGGYSIAMVAALSLRQENKVQTKVFGFLPVTKVVWTDEMNRHRRRGFFCVIAFMLLSQVGAYLAGLPMTINGTRIQ